MLNVSPSAGKRRYFSKFCYRLCWCIPLLFSSLSLFAQSDKVQMADGLRSSGKIYVVVAVLLTILVGLILYLVRLDRKISRLEKNGMD